MASHNEYRSYPDGGQPHPQADRGVKSRVSESSPSEEDHKASGGLIKYGNAVHDHNPWHSMQNLTMTVGPELCNIIEFYLSGLYWFEYGESVTGQEYAEMFLEMFLARWICRGWMEHMCIVAIWHVYYYTSMKFHTSRNHARNGIVNGKWIVDVRSLAMAPFLSGMGALFRPCHRRWMAEIDEAIGQYLRYAYPHYTPKPPVDEHKMVDTLDTIWYFCLRHPHTLEPTFRHCVRGFSPPPLIVWRPLPADRGNSVAYGEGLGVISLMDPQHHYKINVVPMIPTKCSGWLMVEEQDVEVCSGWVLEGCNWGELYLNSEGSFEEKWWMLTMKWAEERAMEERELDDEIRGYIDDDEDSLRDW